MKMKRLRFLIPVLLLTAMAFGLLAGCGAYEAAVSGGVPEYAAPAQTASPALDPDGEYTSPEQVAEYLHTYGCLPPNFITKSEARKLGWDNAKGNLQDVAPGKSIGGDSFGNREGLLPKGVEYHECDVNYSGGYRGGERLVYGDDGSIYYTGDHYSSFRKLY